MMAPVFLLLVAAAPAPAELLRLRPAPVLVEFLADPETRALCGGAGVLEFELRAPAAVRFSIGGQAITGSVDGAPSAPLQAVAVAPGAHRLTFEQSPWPEAPLAAIAYSLEARGDAGATALTGRVVADTLNRAGLKVGRTFLSGVDLFDGHLIRRAADVSLHGRHIALDTERIYSTASRGLRGLLGAGWSLSWGALAARPGCGLYSVLLYGTPQTFRSADGGRTFEPERGYHTALRRLADGSFEFEDKAGNRHHFTAGADDWGIHRLAWTEEPHGDRIELAYDAGGRLTRLAEVQRVGPGVVAVPRVLRVGHVSAGGFDRIAWIDAPGLGLRVDYTYDARGSLTMVRRHDEDEAQPAVESYEYADGDDGGPGPMTAATVPEEGRATYEYGRPAGRPARVSRVVNRPASGELETIPFAYDRQPDGTVRSTAGDGAGTTRYLLNDDGSPVSIDEADGLARRVTRMTWDHRHIVKLTEHTDNGRHAEYRYDDHGNLVSVTEVERPGRPARTVSYAYHPRFSKLVFRDQGGQVSTWRLDPRTGDLLHAAEAGKPAVSYRFDDQGRLLEEVDEHGRRTVYENHDTFGVATRVTGPDGRVKETEYDVRGRRLTNPAP